MTKWKSIRPLKEFSETHEARIACTAIAHKHFFEFDELFERRRDAAHSAARAECFARLREAPFAWSLPKIGAAFEMDHTTVLYHLNNLAGRRRERRAAAPSEHVSP